jgi:hypothetical protein
MNVPDALEQDVNTVHVPCSEMTGKGLRHRGKFDGGRRHAGACERGACASMERVRAGSSVCAGR